MATLALGFLTLVETAYLFGIGKVCLAVAGRGKGNIAEFFLEIKKYRYTSIYTKYIYIEYR